MTGKRHKCIAGGCGAWVHTDSPICPQHMAIVGEPLSSIIGKAWRERGWNPAGYAEASKQMLERLVASKKGRNEL